MGSPHTMLLFRSVLGCLLMSSVAVGLGLDLATTDQSNEDGPEGRFLLPLFLSNSGAGFNINLTIIATFLASLGSGLLSLFTLTGLGLLAASNMNKQDDHSGYSSSHGSTYRRMLDPADLDWESISFVDWISILHDTWTSFDPSDFECQKRFICDVHQSKEELGPMAGTIIYYFSYLQYGQVLSLPEAINSLLDEYISAADLGRTMQKDCGDIYSGCDFSVKSLVHKYSQDANDEGVDSAKEGEVERKKGTESRIVNANTESTQNISGTASNAYDNDGANTNNYYHDHNNNYIASYYDKHNQNTKNNNNNINKLGNQNSFFYNNNNYI